MFPHPRLFAALFSLAALAGSTLRLAPRAPAQQIVTASSRRLTITPPEGINLNPSLSGDGARLAFESTVDIANIGGQASFRLIGADLAPTPVSFVQMAATRAVAPAVSQDGSRICFAATSDPLAANTDGNSEIFLFHLGLLRQLTNTAPGDITERVRHGNFQPSISDDGRFIAFSSNRNLLGTNTDANLEVFVFDVTTDSFTQLTETVGIVGASDAKISGDGLSVAYIRDNTAHGAPASLTLRDLVLQDRRNNRAPRVVATAVPGLALTPGRSISDDGTRIVYAADTSTANATQVFLFDARINLGRQITRLGARREDVPLHPTISGDGRRISFATRRANVTSENSDGGVELYGYDVPTAHFTRLTDAPPNAVSDVVSTLNDDGSVVAFNFPRVLSGPVAAADSANNCEIYVATIPPRPSFSTDLQILNAASRGREPSSPKTFAPDSIAVGVGSNLARTTAQAARLPDDSFPLSLGGTTVMVGGRSAQLFYVSPGQVHFHIPAATPLGDTQVVITNPDGFESRTQITLTAQAPGIFTESGDGQGASIALDAATRRRAPFEVGEALDSTDSTQRIAIFATGVRGLAAPRGEVTAMIGGHSVQVEAVTSAPDFPGLDQLHLLVPRNFSSTGTFPLLVRAGGIEGNPTTIALKNSAPRSIVINEVLSDPPDGLAGDANRDGTRSASQDEFVELVNPTPGNIDVGRHQLLTRNSSGASIVRHTFASGTIIPAGASLVVFGAAERATFNPNHPAFGGAIVQTASTGGLALLNSASVVSLRDPSGEIVDELFYGSTSNTGISNQSLTRSPDIIGDFTAHASISGGRLFSPGTQADGTPFVTITPVARVEVVPAIALPGSINRGVTRLFSAQAFDANNRIIPNKVFAWSSSNAAIATVDANGRARGTGIGTTTIRATTSDGTGGTLSAEATLTVQVPLVINEILADVPPDNGSTPNVEGDANRDGVRASDDDEFIELLNNSVDPVDLSGVRIADATSNRYTFPAGTMLAPGRAVVIFGGGSAPTSDPAFGGALVLTASSLGLNDTGDTVTVKLAVAGVDVQIATQSYGTGGAPAEVPPAPSNQSLTRSPDAAINSPGGSFVAHTSTLAAAGRIYSPGTRLDGTPFSSLSVSRGNFSLVFAESDTARNFARDFRQTTPERERYGPLANHIIMPSSMRWGSGLYERR